MTSLKIAIAITCGNPNIQSSIKKFTQNALFSERDLSAVKIVRDESWNYLLRYTVIEKDSLFVEIHVKYNWNRYVLSQTSHSTDVIIDQVDTGVFQIPLGELHEFCLQQVQTFAKWRKRWGAVSQGGV